MNEICPVQEKVELLNPKPGYFEIEPEVLWSKIVRVIQNAVKGKFINEIEFIVLVVISF